MKKGCELFHPVSHTQPNWMVFIMLWTIYARGNVVNWVFLADSRGAILSLKASGSKSAYSLLHEATLNMNDLFYLLGDTVIYQWLPGHFRFRVNFFWLSSIPLNRCDARSANFQRAKATNENFWSAKDYRKEGRHQLDPRWSLDSEHPSLANTSA